MSVKKYIALVLNYCYFFWSSNPENKTTHLWKQNIISNYTAFKHFLLRRQRPFSAVDPPPLDVSLQAKTNCTWQWWIPLPAALGGCIHPPSSLSPGHTGPDLPPALGCPPVPPALLVPNICRATPVWRQGGCFLLNAAGELLIFKAHKRGKKKIFLFFGQQ